MEALYERQLKWRADAKKQAVQTRETEVEDPECTFTPKMYSVPVKKFEGPARQLSEKSGSNHVRRYTKARQDKMESDGSKSKPAMVASLLPVEMNQGMSGIASASSMQDGYGDKGNMLELDDFDAYKHLPENVDATEESLVELLERERREWQLDRVKLIHCIHLQQLELTQRAAASHEKAAEIAKEFARAIESLERLVLVESGVQKEIMAIKATADVLATAIPRTNTVDERLKTLENGISTILNKLDGISTTLAAKK